ncbi:hypothetical protein [Hoeflea algicola]|uniref:NrdR family transcriptional regulator n=1 Tax=Hoeflea algicola TaxID=2983763 RepID=UPI003CE58242
MRRGAAMRADDDDARGIPCPGCGRRNSRVIDSRFNDATIKRRRSCGNCGGRFTTLEQVISYTPKAQVRSGNPAWNPARGRAGIDG